MKLVVGLGNPGKNYENTRHNIGFMILDKYLGKVKYKEKFNGEYYELGNTIFLKPLTFMNNSGDCVIKFINYFNIDIKDILIIQDDLDISVGKYKFKENSSSGGHNGIKSIISNLGTDSFFRLKVGISNDLKNDVIDFVLGRFSKTEINLLNFEVFNRAIDDFINYDKEYVMNKYNGK